MTECSNCIYSAYREDNYGNPAIAFAIAMLRAVGEKE
jgi:hypothetical protein